jgi:hypothetical protein
MFIMLTETHVSPYLMLLPGNDGRAWAQGSKHVQVIFSICLTSTSVSMILLLSLKSLLMLPVVIQMHDNRQQMCKGQDVTDAHLFMSVRI